MESNQKQRLIELFEDPEYRHVFFDASLNTSIAAQIKANREDRGWSQKELGKRAGMKQSRISAMENVNYDRWSISTLRRLAKAFDLALSVRLDSFGKALEFKESLSESLVEPGFGDDPRFQGAADNTDYFTTPNHNVYRFRLSNQSGEEPDERSGSRTRSETFGELGGEEIGLSYG